MNRVRFIPYAWGGSWEELGKFMEAARYTDGESKGVKITDYSKREIRATYYEKMVYSEIVDDPINGRSDVSRIVFWATEFVVYDTGVLVVKNGLRRAPSLITFLMVKTEFEFSVDEQQMNIFFVLSVFRDLVGNLTVDKAAFKQFNVSENLKCSASFVGKSDVFLEMSEAKMRLPEFPNKISFLGDFNGKRIRGEIHDSGIVAMMHNNFYFIIDKIAARGTEVFIPFR